MSKKARPSKNATAHQRIQRGGRYAEPESGRNDEREGQESKEHELLEKWPWLLPLAAGIFLGGAAIEIFPEALDKAGAWAWLWGVVGLVIFILVRDGLDAIGRHGLAWVATLGIWIHSFLEGAVTATSYSASFTVGLLVSAGMILHLIPEVGAVIALLGAAGVSLKSALIRNGVTWALIIIGFLVTYFFLPHVAQPVLGSVLAGGAGGFLYLAWLSWQEREWGLWPSVGVAAVGIAVMAVIKLVA